MNKLDTLNRRFSASSLGSRRSSAQASRSPSLERPGSSAGAQDTSEAARPRSLSAALSVPPQSAAASPREPAASGSAPPGIDASSLIRQRAERLVDGLVLKKHLLQVLSDPGLNQQRQQIVEFLLSVPKQEAKRLCQDTVLWAGPNASALPLCATLLTLLIHRQERLAAFGSAQASVVNVLPTLMVQEAQFAAQGAKNTYLALLAYMATQHDHEELSNVDLAKKLLIARVDPPPLYAERWADVGQEDAEILTDTLLNLQLPYLLAQTERMVEAQATPFSVVHWAMALCQLCDDEQWSGQKPLEPEHDFVSWSKKLQHSLPQEDAAACARFMVGTPQELREATWAHATQLDAFLPAFGRAQLLDELAGYNKAKLETISRYVQHYVPPWADTAQTALFLELLGININRLTPELAEAYDTYVRPQMDLPERRDLLVGLIAWHQDSAASTAGWQTAKRQLAEQQVPPSMVASVLRAWRFNAKEHAQLRPGVSAFLQSGMDPLKIKACIEILMEVPEQLRQSMVAKTLAGNVAAAPRDEDTESTMHWGRIRASDLVVSQIVDRVPRSAPWRSTLNQIIAFAEAAKADPKTDPLLLSQERTGVSELDNALHVLKGPMRAFDQTEALIADPTYPLTYEARVVGLGHVAAGIWQLLRDSPQPAASAAQLADERRTVRVNFILALARSVESTGFRVCGWGLSERLTEACAGYIEGIEQAPMVYPNHLLIEWGQAFEQTPNSGSRASQEAFYHSSLLKADHALFSPEAVAVFSDMLLEFMHVNYDWPRD